MFDIEIISGLRCPLDHLAHKGFVLRMYPLDDEFYARLRPRLVFKNSERFLGPENFPARDDPAETARLTQALGFGQMRLAPLQFLTQSFFFGDIHDRAGETL